MKMMLTYSLGDVIDATIVKETYTKFFKEYYSKFISAYPFGIVMIASHNPSEKEKRAIYAYAEECYKRKINMDKERG